MTPSLQEPKERTYNVFDAYFQYKGTIALVPKYFDQANAEALALAKKQFPLIQGIMVSPIRSYVHDNATA